MRSQSAYETTQLFPVSWASCDMDSSPLDTEGLGMMLTYAEDRLKRTKTIYLHVGPHGCCSAIARTKIRFF
jgi:hypothetical protein